MIWHFCAISQYTSLVSELHHIVFHCLKLVATYFVERWQDFFKYPRMKLIGSFQPWRENDPRGEQSSGWYKSDSEMQTALPSLFSLCVILDCGTILSNLRLNFYACLTSLVGFTVNRRYTCKLNPNLDGAFLSSSSTCSCSPCFESWYPNIEHLSLPRSCYCKTFLCNIIAYSFGSWVVSRVPPLAELHDDIFCCKQ